MPDAKLSMERRTTPRVSIKVPVKYRLEKEKKVLRTIEEWRHSELNCFTLDMSLGGMSVVVDQPLSVGEVLCFELYLLDEKASVTIYAEVMWANNMGAGLRFLMMKDEEMRCLRAFLEKSSVAYR